MKIGSIDFINSLPVDQGILSGAVSLNGEMVRDTPTQLNQKILNGELDMSPVSSIWFAKNHQQLVLMPELCISSASAVKSVLLFSRMPISKLAGKKIAITEKGATTPALLEVICRYRYGFTPQFVVAKPSFASIPDGCDAILLIGDDALRAKELSSSTRFTDLAEEWKSWTNLPFVFAVWVARREYLASHPQEVKAAHEALVASRKWGAEHAEAILERSEQLTELQRPVLESYFSRLSYELDDTAMAGMRLFWHYARKAGLLNEEPAVQEAFTGKSYVSFEGISTVDQILDKALRGERVTVQEGVVLYHMANVHDLGMVANELALRKNPRADKDGTFVVDRNINYTNYCYTLCKFCAFYRLPGDTKEGYTRTNEEIFDKIEELIQLGGTQVLLQGGHNPQLGIEYYEDIVKAVKSRFPQVHVHSFSASEIKHIAKTSNITVKDVLLRLKAVGLNSLPGGGAEILSDRVRKIVSPLKTRVADYFEVHRAAHEVGLISTATMVYGLGETVEERMEHFEHYRTLQDETKGFRAFIPWSFESESTEMAMPRRSGGEYLRMIALSRIMLDNIQHLQAGWVTEGPKLSQIAMLYGADDFGGILMEENVVSATKSDKLYAGVTKEEAIRLIRESGKTPTQRNTNYEIVQRYQSA